MLESIFRYRPSDLCAVYIEPGRIEVCRARRVWRTWERGVAEQFHVPEGESVFDHLQRLNLKPATRKGSALLAIVSGVFYSVHSEYYPLSIKDQLGSAINFDWQENVFQEHDRTLHFFGPPVALERHVSVPIFAIQSEVHDQLNQALNGALFHTFAVAPSALLFAALLPEADQSEEESEILARSLDNDTFEAHRFYRGAFLDSSPVGKFSRSLNLFGENLRGICGEKSEPHVHFLCLPGESQPSRQAAAKLDQTGVRSEVLEVQGSFVSNWLDGLLKQDTIHTFDSEVLLKPWQLPRIAWPLAALVLLFALYGFYQSYSARSLAQTSSHLKVRIDRLQARWQPLEELQMRITNFEQDKKTLAEFNREDYRLRELLDLLSDRTPGDTWLDYFSLSSGQLILRGESKSALQYLAALSKVEGLTEVKFASPVSRDPGNDMERFNIELQLDMNKLKTSFKALPHETSAEGLAQSPLPPNGPPLTGAGPLPPGPKVYPAPGAVHNQASKESRR
ncbi:MAG: PilN domain-containing protein [Syntrophobacteraceae bacterium]|nr:PilN domain-containing protein [Syntrophobacteraceae bacterium]